MSQINMTDAEKDEALIYLHRRVKELTAENERKGNVYRSLDTRYEQLLNDFINLAGLELPYYKNEKEHVVKEFVKMNGVRGQNKQRKIKASKAVEG